MTDLTSALAHLLSAKRISAPSQSYRKDNPAEYAKVKAYLDGGARPSGVVTEMGLGLVEVEDVRRAQVVNPGYLLNEEFTSFDSARWTKKWWWDGDQYGSQNTEEQAYRDYDVTVASGVLSLTAKRENITDYTGFPKTWSSGMIQSNGLDPGPRGFSFTYGLVEARIKMPRGPGVFPAFWLCDASYAVGCSREIDIVEMVGWAPQTAYFGISWHDLHIAESSRFDSPVPLADDYHVYGCDWRPTYVAFFVDGVEHYRYTGAGIPSEPHYIILNFALGGNWSGPTDASTPDPQSMLVDWVRVTA